jgi:pimeloyl-ACP methyl ester carboxylesterase
MITNSAHSIRTIIALTSLALVASCTGDTLKQSYLEYSSVLLPPPTRPVIVMSGFGNSKLYDPTTDRYVWGTAHATLQTRYADNLDLPVDSKQEQIEHDRLIPRGFVGYRSPLNFAWHISRALEKYGKYTMARAVSPDSQEPRTVYRFAYDWRLSAMDNARRLDSFIEQIRRAHDDPGLKVDIVGHSLGGFITLTYLRMGVAPIEAPQQWDRASQAAAEKIGSVVLLGAPQQGSVDAFRVLLRPERFVMRVLSPEWTATYPSLTEMLPTDGRFLIDERGAALDIDLWDPSVWRRYKFSIFDDAVRARVEKRQSQEHYRKLTVAFEKSLLRAKALREVHERPLPQGISVTTIASDCMPTTRRVLMRPDRTFAFHGEELQDSEKHLGRTMFVPGDGSITTESATGGRTDHAAIFCDGHQGMALDATVHHAILRALQRGSAPPTSAAIH